MFFTSVRLLVSVTLFRTQNTFLCCIFLGHTIEQIDLITYKDGTNNSTEQFKLITEQIVSITVEIF